MLGNVSSARLLGQSIQKWAEFGFYCYGFIHCIPGFKFFSYYLVLRVTSHFPFCILNVPAPPSAVGFLCVPILQRWFLSFLTAGALVDCGEPFQVWEMWLSPHSEKPVGSKVGRQDPRPWIGSPVGNQACIVPWLLWDLLLLKLPHPEASKSLLSIFIFLKSGLDLPGMEQSPFDHFSLYIANILWCIQRHPLLCLQNITTQNKPLHGKGGPSLM